MRGFRLGTNGVADETQVHFHRRYAEFGEILSVMDALDADVICLEAARSRIGVTHELAQHEYERQVGLSVDEVHSPWVPTQTELAERIGTAAASPSPAQLWVNPDCGLKTRRYDEIEPSLRATVEAARQMRNELSSRPMLGKRGSMETPPGPPA